MIATIGNNDYLSSRTLSATMADNTPGPSAVTKAKPTVRVKGKEHEYGETLEFHTFQSRGGNPEELMDEERFLDYPGDYHKKNWTDRPSGVRTGQKYDKDWD